VVKPRSSLHPPRRLIVLAAWAFGPALLLLAFVAFGASRGWFAVGELTMDLTAIANRPVYFGAVSGVGFQLWAASAAVCAMSALIARRRGERAAAGMFAGFGVLSVVLLADDWLLLHEHVMPLYLGVSEKALVAAYACGTLGLLVAYRRVLVRHDWPLLLAAFAMFATSVITDQISGSGVSSQRLMLIEDGTKLLGISGWFAYFFNAGLRSTKHPPPAGG
jgi:hypothetical protein